MGALIYLHILTSLIICADEVRMTKIKYTNPFAESGNWMNSLSSFLHRYENFCSYEDYDVTSNNKSQDLDDIPYFSPCNLSQRDLLNVFKLLQFENKNGKLLLKKNLMGCSSLPQESKYKIVINKTVLCSDHIKGKCLMRFGDNFIALPGTQLRFKCRNSLLRYDEKQEYRSTICEENKWSGQISECHEFENPRKSNSSWYKPTIWTPPLFSSECGQRKVNKGGKTIDFIHNGAPAKPGMFPWHAAVYYNQTNGEEYQPHCGASIISDRYLLSAAHCFIHPGSPSDFFVVCGSTKGSYRLERDDDYYGEYYEIEEIITACLDYCDQNTKLNDIAIIITKSNMHFDDLISPICLINDDSPYILENATLLGAGCGITETGGRGENLKYTSLTFTSYDECVSRSDDYTKKGLTAEKFCAWKEAGKSMSFDGGDSGGGLVILGPNDRYYLMGVVSSNVKEHGTTILCINVPKLHHWIRKTIQERALKNVPKNDGNGNEMYVKHQ